jgi:hypothetical protein
MLWTNAWVLISEIQNLKYRGTDWEQEFLRDLERQRPAVLSPRQSRALESIYAKAAGGGCYERRYISGSVRQ